MSSAAETVENASIISESVAHDGNRLWIGNIDPKITEWVHCYFNFSNVVMSVQLWFKKKKEFPVCFLQLDTYMLLVPQVRAETTRATVYLLLAYNLVITF